MNRRLWMSVGLVVAVLGVGAAGKRVLGWVDRASRTVGWPALAGVAVVAAGAVIVTGKRRQRSGYAEPWRTVIHMGRQGRSASAIAQATGLPQDAVRIALAPVPVESFQRGNSFRSSRPDDPARRSDAPPRSSR